MNKEEIKKIFQNTFIAIEKFKQQRIRLSIEELKKHMEMDEAMQCICELFRELKQSEQWENTLKKGMKKIEEDKKENDN